MNHTTRNPDRPGLRLALAACAAGLSTSAGCALFRGDDADDAVPMTPASTTQQSYTSEQAVPASLQPANRPIVQERLPLLYLVDGDGVLSVSNVDTGEEILTFPVKASQILRVEQRGILLEGKTLLGASLAPGTYAVAKVMPADAGSLRVTQTRTRAVPPQPRPASRPASATPPPR